MRYTGLAEIPDLWKATYDLVSQVPIGKVTTYGQVARALGDVVASRFVGLAMSRNEDIARVPCRRVVQSDGRVGGYTGGGPEKKASLLRAEGVRVDGDKVQDLDEVMFSDFVSSQPLKGLRDRQVRLKSLSHVPRADIDVKCVAGIDVAYRGEHAYAAAALIDFVSGEVVDEIVHEDDAVFPYVPTYLAFRELPVVSSLLRDLPEETVLMYDGNGLLHPEGMGIATHAGIAFGLPTIGVAKSRLCGTRCDSQADGAYPVSLDCRVVGYEMMRAGSSKPVYVSVGDGISPRQMLKVVRRFSRHRVPEPTRVAHILAERARRGTSHK